MSFSIFITSLFAVFVAELGDKTQLLSLFLVNRFKTKIPIILGIILASVVSQLLAAYIGILLGHSFDSVWITRIAAVGFILIGLWIFIPEKDKETNDSYFKYGAFLATFMFFIIGEFGDKTQITTLTFAIKFSEFSSVFLGGSLGLLLANIPIVFFGDKILSKIPLCWIKSVSCLMFISIGVFTLIFG